MPKSNGTGAAVPAAAPAAAAPAAAALVRIPGTLSQAGLEALKRFQNGPDATSAKATAPVARALMADLGSRAAQDGPRAVLAALGLGVSLQKQAETTLWGIEGFAALRRAL